MAGILGETAPRAQAKTAGRGSPAPRFSGGRGGAGNGRIRPMRFLVPAGPARGFRPDREAGPLKGSRPSCPP